MSASSSISPNKKERKPVLKISKKIKKQLEEQKELSSAPSSSETETTLKEKKQEKGKKSSKFISKQSCIITESEKNKPIEIHETQSSSAFIQQQETPIKKQNLPNVVVCFRCQLSDLQQTETSEEQHIIENKPFEYKAWVSSDIKTYNNEYQIGNLSMEPLNNHGQKDNNMDHYAYLDTKWLNLISNQSQGNENNPNKMMNMGGFINHDSNKDMSEKKYESFDASSHSKYDNQSYLKTGSSSCSSSSCLQTVSDTVVGMGDISMKHEKERNERVLFKETQEKIYHQKVLLYHGLVKNDKKSACFWCTCDYDTPSCAIPYYNVQGNLDGYGSFCRPECAVAFLYSEKLDDSIRADRDHLINYYYGKSFGYEKRIKPAPDPHYLLDKFYGNLTIQEYRKLLKSEHLLATLDKPLTRVFPELHEITDDFLIKIYGGDITLNRGYRVKRASEQNKAPSKMEILRDQFRPPSSAASSVKV
jgi:hypothetical protein